MPITPRNSPQNRTDRPATHHFAVASIAALSADPDLDGLSGYPAWGPDRTTLSSTDAAAFVYTDEDGTEHTITVHAGSPVVINRPIVTVDESASGAVTALFEWWDGGSNFINP